MKKDEKPQDDQQPQEHSDQPQNDENQQVVEDLTADLQRLQADFVNYRNRSEQQVQSAVNTGKESVIKELLTILDNLDRAISHQPEDLKDNDWVKGVASVAKQLQQKMADLGLQKIETSKQEFNPDTMEAISVDGEGTKEMVVQELQSGYIYNDQVLRAALVRVERQ